MRIQENNGEEELTRRRGDLSLITREEKMRGTTEENTMTDQTSEEQMTKGMTEEMRDRIGGGLSAKMIEEMAEESKGETRDLMIKETIDGMIDDHLNLVSTDTVV